MEVVNTRPADLLIRLADDSEAIPRLFEATESCTIGRGYRNQLVINDEYADACAVQLSRTADQQFWQLALVDNSVNVRLNDRPLEAGAHYRIENGDELTIGKTTLVLIDPDVPVAAARPLNLHRWQGGFLGILFTLASLMLVLAGFQGLEWLLINPTSNWRETLVFVTAGLMVASMWAGIWALVGKLFRQQAAFFDHLLALTTVLAITMPLEYVPDWLAFTTNTPLLNRIADHLISLLLVFLLISKHMALATRLKRPRMVAAMATLILTGILAVNEFNSFESRQYWPSYSNSLAPASWYLGPVQSPDEYLDELGQLLDQMPAAADEPMPDDTDPEALIDMMNE